MRSDNGLVFNSRHFTAIVCSYGLKQAFIDVAAKASDIETASSAIGSASATTAASSRPSHPHACRVILIGDFT
ncbi:hypothetical protein [Pararhodobacter oceanensis]|uniref:hypothetical protein n=1 Tax=Pararhodobacter oceanensis TaxID=2172121 RepID=UPI0019803526|nr:hypothetical protein [Pararhodobacter oceanensis]